MKPISFNELKAIEFDVLKYIDEICQQNNLRYFLAGGTLLGAVRHKGFIPWDDDIDISMPRNDYYKFVKILKNKSNEIPYMIYDYQNRKEYLWLFSKLVDSRTTTTEKKIFKSVGVGVDIFVIDGLGESESKAKRSAKVIYYIRSLFSLTRQPAFFFRSTVVSIIIFPLWCLCRLLGEKFFLNMIDKYIKRYSYETSSWVGCVVGGWYKEREVLSSSVFLKSIDVLFEGKQFKAPIGYDEYLSSLYGDYMKLPPIDEQRPRHQIEAWWIESTETGL